jgi:hypothetical protein
MGEGDIFVSQITVGGPDCKKSTLGHLEMFSIGFKTELTECAFTDTACDMPMGQWDESDKAMFPEECTMESYKKPIPQMYKQYLGADTCEKYIAILEEAEDEDTDGSESEKKQSPVQ